jgi:hypothetical protein
MSPKIGEGFPPQLSLFDLPITHLLVVDDKVRTVRFQPDMCQGFDLLGVRSLSQSLTVFHHSHAYALPVSLEDELLYLRSDFSYRGCVHT